MAEPQDKPGETSEDGGVQNGSVQSGDVEGDTSAISAVPVKGRLAGIDFGTVRIGVAICDSDQIISSPFETYNRRTIDLDAKYFVKLVADEKISGFVIGLPVHMSGDESQKSGEARKFGKWLSNVTQLPVTWIDERYTSALAKEMLRGSPLSGKKKKKMLDKLAAQIILATYLERGGEASPDAIED